MRRAGAAAAAAVIGWYVFALWILHPLTDAPVVDSWLYGSAVRRYLRTGEIRFAGYSQATPIAQVVVALLGSSYRVGVSITVPLAKAQDQTLLHWDDDFLQHRITTP